MNKEIQEAVTRHGALDRRRRLILLLSLLISSFLGQSARAQTDNGLPHPQPYDAGGVIMRQMLLKMNLDQAFANGSKYHPVRGRHPVPAQSSALTAYQASPAVSARVQHQVAAWVASLYTKGLPTVNAQLEKDQSVQTWTRSVATNGLRPGDVSDALASYWILNYLIAKGTTESTRAQALAVRRQVQPALAASPTFIRFTNAQRQEMAETMMLHFVLEAQAYQLATAQHNQTLKQQLGNAAVTRFQKEMGIDLRRLSLTDHGFAPR